MDGQSQYLATTYASLFNIFLSTVYHALDALPELKPGDIAPYIQILETVRESGLLERFEVDVGARMRDVEEQVRSVAGRWYEERRRELSGERGREMREGGGERGGEGEG